MKKIPLTQGRFALVDDADFERINQFKWHFFRSNFKNDNGYAATYIGGGRKNKITMFMHHVVLRRVNGYEIDHIDGDGLNNQSSNLRLVTHQQNLLNKDKYKNNKSGFKGVSLVNSRWRARIKIPGKTYKHIGYFETRELASEAYQMAAEKYHGLYRRAI